MFDHTILVFSLYVKTALQSKHFTLHCLRCCQTQNGFIRKNIVVLQPCQWLTETTNVYVMIMSTLLVIQISGSPSNNIFISVCGCCIFCHSCAMCDTSNSLFHGITYGIALRFINVKSIVKSFPEPQGPWGGADLCFLSPQPGTSRSRKTTDTGPVYRVVCPFTPRLSLVLINRPRRDGRWYTATKGGIRTLDLAVASPAPYHSATAYAANFFFLMMHNQPILIRTLCRLNNQGCRSLF